MVKEGRIENILMKEDVGRDIRGREDVMVVKLIVEDHNTVYNGENKI